MKMFTWVKEILAKQIMVGSIKASIGTVAAIVTAGTVAVGGLGYAGYEAFHASTVSETVSSRNDSQENDVPEASQETEIETEETLTGTDAVSDTKDSALEEENFKEEDVHKHDYTKEVITEPTCTSEGLARFTCKECGDFYESAIPKEKHAEGEWEIITEATVHSDGLRVKHCTECSAELAVEVMPVIPCTHNYRTTVLSSASCEHDGEIRYECVICGSSYVAKQSATGHNYVKDSSTNPTCTQEGHTYEKCTNCGHRKETGTIAKLPHKYGEWEVVTEADCITEGKEERTCSVCGLKETRVIQAKGHTEDTVTTVVTTEPTCTAEGEKTYTCSVCNEEITETIPALGHDMKLTGHTDSTCTTDGVDVYECQREGCTYKEETAISATGHMESGWIVDKEPTCTEKGHRYTKCTVCDAIIQSEDLEMIAHDYEDVITAPKCSEQGYTTHTCKVCGDEKIDTYVEALGHDLKKVVDTDNQPTCETDGTAHMVCQREGCTYVDPAPITIPATGHSFTNYVVTKPATDLETGLEVANCDHEGCTATDERTIAKLPHTHDYDTRVDEECVAVTCENDGKEVYVCRCGEKLTTTIPATGHRYELVKTTDATCEMDGAKYYECQNEGCDSAYSEPIKATGHTAGPWEVLEPATDLKEGIKVKYCTKCDVELERGVIEQEEHIHDYDTELERQEATCTEDGYIKRQCRCDDIDTEVLAKYNHQPTEWVVAKEPTYTEMGVEEERCTHCNAVVSTRNIPVLAHECEYEYSEANSKQPTCTEDGYNVSICKFCGATQTVTLTKTGHTESDWIVDKAPDCETTGEHHTICQTCKMTLKTESIPADGHKESGWNTVPATCTEDGYKYTKCSVCEKELQRETIPATGHTMGNWGQTTAPTCTTDGIETRSCACGHSETRSIPMLGHDWGDWIVDVEPTEEAGGHKYKECSRCHETTEEDLEKLPPHVHSYTETGRTESTCTVAGQITYTCDCGASYSETLSLAEHKAGDPVRVEPTEDAEGSEDINCTVCGKNLSHKVLDKLPHTHVYTTEHKDATCTADGYDKETCKCGDTKTTVIPALGHEWGKPVVVEPTCTTEGTSTVTCGRCGEKEITTIDALGHTWVEDAESSVPATCGKAGKTVYKCANCDETREEIIPALSHEYEVTDTIEATCTAGGYTLETCKNCADTRKINETDAIGHTYEWVVTKEPELGVYSVESHICSACGYVEETRQGDMIESDEVDSVWHLIDKWGNEQIIVGHIDEAASEELFNLINQYRVEEYQLSPLTHCIDDDWREEYTTIRAVEANRVEELYPSATSHYNIKGISVTGDFGRSSGECLITLVHDYHCGDMTVAEYMFYQWKTHTWTEELVPDSPWLWGTPSHEGLLHTEYANQMEVKVFAEKLPPTGNGTVKYRYAGVYDFVDTTW